MEVVDELLVVIWESLASFLNDDLKIKSISSWSVLFHLSEIVLICSVITSIFYFFPKLWNIKSHHFLVYKLLSTIVFVLSLIYVSTFISLSYLNQTVTTITKHWQNQLVNDVDWQKKTFRKAYYAVKELGQENFKEERFKPPEDGGNTIPVSHDSSRIVTASIYVKEAAKRFNLQHPFLSKILKTDEAIPEQEIVKDNNRYFQENPNEGYTLDKAIKIAGEKLKTGFDERIPNLIKTTRIIITVAYLVIMMLLFAATSFIAYKDIKIFN